MKFRLAPALPGDLFKKQILRIHIGFTKSETLGVGSNNLRATGLWDDFDTWSNLRNTGLGVPEEYSQEDGDRAPTHST